jgi:hypothetical protein
MTLSFPYSRRCQASVGPGVGELGPLTVRDETIFGVVDHHQRYLEAPGEAQRFGGLPVESQAILEGPPHAVDDVWRESSHLAEAFADGVKPSRRRDDDDAICIELVVGKGVDRCGSTERVGDDRRDRSKTACDGTEGGGKGRHRRGAAVSFAVSWCVEGNDPVTA